MKVYELIERLQNMDPDIEVILQKDAEGNGYSPLDATDDEAIYRPETTYSGQVYSPSWSAEDASFDEKDWERFRADNPRCCVLAPVN